MLRHDLGAAAERWMTEQIRHAHRRSLP
jgi:hypothetical protein